MERELKGWRCGNGERRFLMRTVGMTRDEYFELLKRS
jgi:hypothetical protein